MKRFSAIIGTAKWISSWNRQFAALVERQTVNSPLFMTPTVTLENKCWEGDRKHILEGEWLRLLAERNAYPFSEKILMVNNVKDRSVVSRQAERAVQRGWITKYIIVEEHAADALEYFSVSRESLGIGYPYSVATGGDFFVPLRFSFALRRRLHAGHRQRLGFPRGGF